MLLKYENRREKEKFGTFNGKKDQKSPLMYSTERIKLKQKRTYLIYGSRNINENVEGATISEKLKMACEGYVVWETL